MTWTDPSPGSPYAAGLESAALPDADAVLDTIARTFAI